MSRAEPPLLSVPEPMKRPNGPTERTVGPALDHAGEQALLDRLARGERAAAEALVDQTYRGVFAALVRLTGGDRDLAADLAQETYRRAWQALPRFDRRSRLLTWLYRIGYNAFLNQRRRPRRVVPLDDERSAPEPRDPAPSADQVIAVGEVAARLRQAVIALPEELRFTVTARFWAELPVADIAHQERVTGAAIRKRLKKAMTMLRTQLEEDAA